MSLLAKTLFGTEIVLCFLPAIALWLLGIYLLPVHIHTLISESSIESAIWIGWIIAGGYGLVALFAVVREILLQTENKLRPGVVKPGLVVGFLAVLPFVHPAFPNPWNLLAIAPLLATVHIAYLGRNYLFNKDA